MVDLVTVSDYVIVSILVLMDTSLKFSEDQSGTSVIGVSILVLMDTSLKYFLKTSSV